MTSTTTTTRSAANTKQAVDNRRIVSEALAQLPNEQLDPATADGFEFGAKVLNAAASAAAQLETVPGVRTFAFRLNREFSSPPPTPFALGVTLACSRVLYSDAQ
jgi:hypothetical protein